MTTWKATAYVRRYRTSLIKVRMYSPGWWQFSGDDVEFAPQYRTAKAAMRAAERYVDAMTRKDGTK